MYVTARRMGEHEKAEKILKTILEFDGDSVESNETDYGLIINGFLRFKAIEEAGLAAVRLFELTGKTEHKDETLGLIERCKETRNNDGAQRIEDALTAVELKKS